MKLILAILLLAPQAALPAGPATNTVLGISGDRFTINGQPEFLLGISAFDAVGNATDTELDQLRSRGFRLIRVWGYWQQGILKTQAPHIRRAVPDNVLFRPDGSLDPVKLKQLTNLLERTDQRGLVIDVTVFNNFVSFPEDYLQRCHKGLRELTAALIGYKNCLFDVYNEYDYPGKASPYAVGDAEIGRFVKDVKSIDPSRIVTASSTLADKQWREKVATGVDCLTPHLRRNADFAEKTGLRVEQLKQQLDSIGRRLPVYLQEEARRRQHKNINPTAEQFFQAAKAAHDSGAAAWIFHTDAGYNYSLGSLFDRLDSVERATADGLGAQLGLAKEQRQSHP